tara:strand:+ start:549 stop:1814 length:1266 start_codon:yes stop_codon:yes gene_type:complete
MHNKNKTDFVCGICNESDLSLIINFGEFALAGAFLKSEDFKNEKKFPIRLCFCNNCFTVQIIDRLDPKILFQDYFYFSSSIETLRSHFKQYAKDVTSRFLDPSKSTVLEFGCNDGVLLKPLADLGIKNVIGVDPAKNVISNIDDKRIIIKNDYLNEQVAHEIVKKFGKVDMILANNVYAHIDNMQGTTSIIKNTLNENGVFIFEVHYLDKVIQEMHYDFIYHEHLYYHSLLSLTEHFKRYHMTIFDIKPISIHGGSLRFYVCKNSSHYASQISEAVKSLLIEEQKKGYDKFISFQNFSNKISTMKKDLINLLKKLKSNGYTIAGYGASGRANTILQYCGIGQDLISYMIDDAPAKQGYFTPGSHLKIFPSSVLLEKKPPDYIVVFAFSFFDEILKKNKNYIDSGGRMILPIPKVKIYPEVR